MQILNFKQHLQGEKTLATFDIALGNGLTLRRVRLIRGQKGPFIAMPCYSEEIDGKKTWKPYLEVSADKKPSFDAQIYDLLRPLVRPGDLAI